MKDKIGLVGLGFVGTAIAQCLLANDFEVIGFDIDSARCQYIKDLGGNTDGSPAQLAQQVDRIILSLPDTNIVKQVVEGPSGILEAKTPPSYIIDMTTGDPDETVALAKRLTQREIYLLDATISGSSRQVRENEAVFMIGGEEAAFQTCSDIFQTLSEKIFYLGPSGSGSKAKLASNLILGLNRVALAEGLVFANKLGLELKTFLEMLKATPAYSAAMDTKGKKMLAGDFTAESRIRQHHKDVSIILKYAEKAGQELPLSRLHLDALEKAIEAGDGDLDNAAIIREIERRNRD